MWRYLAGAVSSLLLAAAGFFLWTGLAKKEVAVIPAPPIAQPVAASEDAAVAEPPQATEKTREQKRFDRYDHDRNGKIDREEYLKARRKAFAKLDTNGDGKLSFDEYATKAETKFATADNDHNGVLDATEFATTRVQRKSRPAVNCPPAARAVPPADAGDEAN